MPESYTEDFPRIKLDWGSRSDYVNPELGRALTLVAGSLKLPVSLALEAAITDWLTRVSR